MKLGLMISGEYPCIRASKITLAMNTLGWKHDALCRRAPVHYPEAFRKVDAEPMGDAHEFADRIARSEAQILHIHNEPHWPVFEARKAANGRPVILNVHDVVTGRIGSPFDPEEEEAYHQADALIFVSEEQREYARKVGLNVNKPTAIIGNWVPREVWVTRTVLPHIGGLVYAGGLGSRGDGGFRDLSAVADAFEDFHVYPGNLGVDYGKVHETEHSYSVLMHRIAQHDFGFCGVPVPNTAWSVTIPNKFAEYLAAGIPVITMNNPPVAHLVEEYGLGYNIDKVSEIPQIMKTSGSPFYKLQVKRVKEIRRIFTMEANISPIETLYNDLLRGGKQ